MSYEYRKISINSLELDQRNPRFHPTYSQKEAFEVMVTRLEDEITQIALDIAQHGQNPTVLPAVYLNPEGHYIVKDGNRRITAIKALMYPQLIPREFGKLRKKFERIGQGIDRSDFRYINCIVFDKYDEVDRWVKNNHQGPQGGIGQIDWSPIQKMRDRTNRGEFVPALELFELVQNNSEIKLNEDKFPITTFERLVDNKEFKEYLGIDFENNKIVSYRSKEEVIRLITPVVDDVYNKVIDSRSLNDLEGISDYVKKIKGRFIPSEETHDEPEVLHVEPVAHPVSDLPPKPPRKKPGPKAKNTMIDKEFVLDIPKQRISDIFQDLKYLDLKKHTNTISVGFRAFMHLSVKYYRDQNEIPQKNNFSKEIVAVAEHLNENGRLSDTSLMSVKSLCSRDDDAIGIATELNQYEHNYEFNPDPKSLSCVWSSLEELVRAIWSAKN